jgi:hypothetical protein
MQGNKTHDQQVRIIERKEGLAAADDRDAALGSGQELGPAPNTGPSDHDNGAFPSLSGTHRESRDHNKHNHAGQEGHGRQKHSPAEEKS